ncbi:NADH-quinone oxidoreductase subunit B, partial [Chloroflexota bacterium]
MEVGRVREYIYSDTELDQVEGQVIEELKANSQEIIPDPDQWLEQELEQNILLTSVDALINWGRRSSLWTAICFPACCAFEFIAASGPRFDL